MAVHRTYRYPRRNDIPFLAWSHIFLHVILRIPRTNPPPLPLRTYTHPGPPREPKATTASLKNIDSRIELDVRTKYCYISPLSLPPLFFPFSFFLFSFFPPCPIPTCHPLALGTSERGVFSPPPQELSVNPLGTTDVTVQNRSTVRKYQAGKPSSILDLVSRIGETIKTRCFATWDFVRRVKKKKETRRDDLVACVCVHVHSQREVWSAIFLFLFFFPKEKSIFSYKCRNCV